ncbi:hypothetical protein NMV45_11365 [Pasteurella multocida]|nr:hypothetical protein [Pasteurella multocida]MDY0596012.1 hypothetical protein [Pasteurella multocida]MDY0667546.1 hypothetical protein [Pasteurella multocida]
MARIELVEQKNFLITLLSALFVIFILLLVSFISLSNRAVKPRPLGRGYKV